MKGEWMNGDSGVPIRDSPPFDSRRLLDRGIELANLSQFLICGMGCTGLSCVYHLPRPIQTVIIVAIIVAHVDLLRDRACPSIPVHYDPFFVSTFLSLACQPSKI